MSTSSAPAAPPMPPTYTPRPLTADELRQRNTRYLRAGGQQSYRKRVMVIAQPLLDKHVSHEVIAAHLTASQVARYNGAHGWQASSIKALLKAHARDAYEAQAARERYARQPKGEAAAARILKADIYQPDFQHFHHYSKPETTP